MKGILARALLATLALQPIAKAAHAEDQILVTAAKRVQDPLEIPGSLAVVAGEDLKRARAFQSGEELTQLLSGVQAAVANGNQIAFQIRGIGAVDHQALTPTAAAVYADGVFLATNVQTGPLLYDLARIEVLKGPQGALYGRNASSGAINFITARPGAEREGYLAASLGRFDLADVAGAIGGPIAPGVSGRIAGRYLRQGPALDNVATNPAFPEGPARAGGRRDEFGVRGALAFEGGRAKALLRVHYEEDNGVNPSPRNTALVVGKHEISVGADGVQDTDNEFYGVALEAEAEFGAWSLYSLSAYEGYGQDYGFDFDGSPAPFGDRTLNANLSYDRTFSQWSEEARAERRHARGYAMVGAAFASESFDQRYLIWCGALDPATLLGDCRYVGAPGRVGPTPASPGVATTLVTDIAQERFAAAAFTRHEIRLAPRLDLVAGARFTHETIEGEGTGRHIFDDGVIAFNNRNGLGPAIGENRIEENRLSGDVALRYRVSERASAYLSFANGYKSGGFNGEVQNDATHFSDEGLFRAETVNAVEAGLRARPSEALSLAGALFYNFYDAPQARIFVNFPLPDGTAITSNSLANLDRARAYGLEASLDWTPAPGFAAGASVTLLETEISQTTDVGGNAALFDGNPLPFASQVSSVAYMRYERPLRAGVKARLAANAKHQTAFFLDAEGLAARRQEGYVLIDAEAALLFAGGFSASVFARNLANEDYAVSGFGFLGYNVFVGPPRSWGVRLEKTF